MAFGTAIRTYFEGKWHEGDLPVMRAADHLVDLGPGAGQHGGHIIYQGPPNSAEGKTKKSFAPNETRRWLSGEKFIPVPAKRRPRGKELG